MPVQVIVVSHFEPRAVGDGGHHRAYQIHHDLQALVGEENIVRVYGRPHFWRAKAAGAAARPSLQARLAAVRRELTDMYRNPFKLRAGTRYSPHSCTTPEMLRDYRALVQRLRPPVVCIIEHTGFAAIAAINKQRQIATIACPHNLESLDDVLRLHGRPAWLKAAALDFVREFAILSGCAERLMISRAEASMVGGLGLPARYYPYLPVGDIRARLVKLRQRRDSQGPEPGLFLMLGSAAHPTTRHSFNWLLTQARRHGLPAGARLVVAGGGTEKLLSTPATGVETRGWLEQDVLDDLLARAQAVLVPQLLGFGALTRLPELSCAGIPVIVSSHASHALELPPNAAVAENSWPDWQTRMRQAMAPGKADHSAAYAAWEARQTRPLGDAVERLAQPGSE